MKKIIILSYFFPPCNLTAANRLKNWYKYLPQNEIYPIVVTRNWTGKELSPHQQLKNSGEKTIHTKDENGEIYYLPYKSSLRDRFFIKGEHSTFFKFLSKISTFIFLFSQNFSLNFIPYRNLFFKTSQLLEEDSSIDTIIISGNPFEQFFFGYLLKKKHPKIKWIADYRDDWTTTDLIKNRNFIQKIIHSFEKKSEIKWLSNASFFTSISPYYVKKISNYISKPGHVVFNGYNQELLALESKNNSNSFSVTYNGSLYQTQKIEIFLSAAIQLIDQYSSRIDIKINFPGIEHDLHQSKRVKKIIFGYEQYFELSGRILKSEVLKKQLESDILLMVAHDNIKGVTSSKIFEYIGLRKPILLCPSDSDILEELVSDINACYSAQDTYSCFEVLESLVKKKIANSTISSYTREEISYFSSRNQVKKLAELIKKL